MSEKLMGILSVIIAAGSVVVVLLTVTGVTVLWRFCKRKYKCCRELAKWRKRSASRDKACASDSLQTTALTSNPNANLTAASAEKDTSSGIVLNVQEPSDDKADALAPVAMLKQARSDSEIEQTVSDKMPTTTASNKSSTSLSSMRSHVPVINVGSCNAIAQKSQAELTNEQQRAVATTGEDEQDSGLVSRLTDETDCTALWGEGQTSPETTGDSPGGWREITDNRQRSWSSRDRVGPRGRRVGTFSNSVSSVEPQSVSSAVIPQEDFCQSPRMRHGAELALDGEAREGKYVALWMRKGACDAEGSQERKFAEMWRARRPPAPRLLPTPVSRSYRPPAPSENEAFSTRLHARPQPESASFAPPCSAAQRWMRQRDNIVKFRSQSDVRGFQTLVTQALDNERSKKRQLPALPCSATSASIHLTPDSDYHPVNYSHSLLRPSYDAYRYNYQPPTLSNQAVNFEVIH